MQIVICEACVVGHCVVVDADNNVMYCGPIKDSMVSEGASVYLNPEDLKALQTDKEMKR